MDADVVGDRLDELSIDKFVFEVHAFEAHDDVTTKSSMDIKPTNSCDRQLLKQLASILTALRQL